MESKGYPEGSVTTHPGTHMADQVSQFGKQATEKIDVFSEQLKEKTNKAIETTTKGIDRVALYFKDKNSQELIDDVQQVIRKHPGKSVLGGLALGLLVGRILR